MAIEATAVSRAGDPYLLAEARHERWLSWIRLSMGVAAAALFVFGFLLGRTTLSVFGVQIGTVSALCLYSGYYLIFARGGSAGRHGAYLLTFFDVTVVTFVLWAYAPSAPASTIVNYSLFCVYFIAIAFTGLHHKARLSLFGGGLAAVEYSLLYFLYLAPETGQPDWLVGYLTRTASLLIVAFLSGVISRNNFLTIQKAVSSEVRYQSLVQRLPEMLCTLDEKGRFLWCNMASFALLGVPARSMAGRGLSDFMIHPEELKLGSEGFRGILEVEAEGNRKFLDCTIRPAEESEAPGVWEGIITDITDREIAISQREEMSNRLFQFQKMESLGTLASGMAHDFNNILQTVRDLSELTEKETREPETRKRMDLMLETLADAKFLVSELLALGRKKPLDSKAIGLRSFFNNCVQLFREQLGQRYKISVKFSEEDLWIEGDADHLKRVFQNFVGNSRDAMPDGGRMMIECFAVRKEGRPDTVVIRFSDDGCGIPRELTESIFDPFVTTKKPGKGTGLGLALVRRIVSLHNGQVFVEKTSSHGTTFRIELPESEREDAEIDTKQLMLNRLSTMILLLDDDVKIRDILRIFIKGLGYAVCEASNLEEAVAELHKNVKDCSIVIMDWRLGADDPHKVIRALRAIKESLVVFVVSGYPPNQKSITSMKIHKWFTKPYDKNMLDIEIQKTLYRLSRPASPGEAKA